MYKSVPEISRINPFEGSDIVQIFGENFDKDTELYVWYNKNAKLNYINLLTSAFAGDKEGANNYKRTLAKELPMDCEGIDNIEALLPELPPEDSIVLKPNDVFERVIYFGEEAGENPDENGVWRRAEEGTSVMWLKNAAGFSKPHIANRPEVWNQSSDIVAPGERITFYGRSFGFPICFDDGTHFGKIGVAKSVKTGEYIRLEGLEDTCYGSSLQEHLAEYRIPANMEEGEYIFYLYGGRCDKFGWSEGTPFTVKNDCSINKYFRTRHNRCAGEILPLPKAKVISICAEDFTPYADYWNKIQGAIDELASEGGIVSLSAGTYPVSKTIVVKPGVILLGSGSATVLKASETLGLTQNWDDVIFTKKRNGGLGWANDWLGFLKEHQQGSVVRLLDNAGIEGMRIELGNGANIGVLVANDKNEYANDVFCNNVTVDGMNLTELEQDGYFGATCAAFLCGARTKNLTVYCCDFTATVPMCILPSRHNFAKIINNKIICRPRQINESAISGLRYSVVANNHFEGGRRSFIAQEGLSHNWIYQNRSTDINRAANALEVYMSEHGKSCWLGKASAVGENYIDINDSYAHVMAYRPDSSFEDIRDEYHYFLFILNGRGFGQYIEVMDVTETETGCRLYLKKPFDVMPDTNTGFSLLFGTHHNLWVHNNSTLSNGHSQFIWDGGFENIVDTHQIDLAAGMRFYSYHGENTWGAYGYGASVCAFNYVLHCQVRASGTGITFNSRRNGFDYDDPKWADLKPTLGVFGNCVKDCAFDGSSGLIYVKNQPIWEEERIGAGVEIDGAYNRVVRNYIFGYDKAISLLSPCEGNCIARNTIKGEKQKFVGEGTPCGVDVKD